MTLIWSWMFEPGFGLLNGVLTSLGLSSVNWLTQPGVAMLSIVLVTVWWTLGFNFLLYLAGLQQISKDMYEASALDGAGWWTQPRSATSPFRLLLLKMPELVGIGNHPYFLNMLLRYGHRHHREGMTFHA